MKIIKPSLDTWLRDEKRGGLAIIERAGRVCYKSEDKISDTSAEGFVKGLIRRHHEAMLEHGDYMFLLDDYKLLDNVAYALRRIMEDTGKRILLTMTCVDNRPIISGNIRAWRELMATGSLAAYYFTGAIDPVYTSDLVPESERIDDPRVHQIFYADLIGRVEKLAHLRQTICFTCDRGVSHEFVRHRVMSYAMESTRYCNYSQDKFGREITVIEPCYLVHHTEPFDLWKRQCMSAEVAYFTLLNIGLSPQEARAVLPHSVKTELVMTGTLGQWEHFFDLRARQVTGAAHPQAAELALPAMHRLQQAFPDVIGGA